MITIDYRTVLTTAGLLVLLLLLIGQARASKFKRQISNRMDRIVTDTPPPVAVPSSVPLLVRVFARRSGAPTTAIREPVPSAIRLRQRCRIRATPEEAWRPMTAEQVIGARTTEFVWWARQKVGPIAFVEVIDAYGPAGGLLEARLFGAISLARFEGPEIDQGEALRYLAELPLVPDALLHNPRLAWRQVAENVVEVQDSDLGESAKIRLIFENGDLARCEADRRPRLEGQRIVPRGWTGWFRDYREMGGRRIPTRLEVAWILEEEPFVYFEGEITDYEVVP